MKVAEFCTTYKSRLPPKPKEKGAKVCVCVCYCVGACQPALSIIKLVVSKRTESQNFVQGLCAVSLVTSAVVCLVAPVAATTVRRRRDKGIVSDKQNKSEAGEQQDGCVRARSHVSCLV